MQTSLITSLAEWPGMEKFHNPRETDGGGATKMLKKEPHPPPPCRGTFPGALVGRPAHIPTLLCPSRPQASPRVYMIPVGALDLVTQRKPICLWWGDLPNTPGPLLALGDRKSTSVTSNFGGCT